VVGMSDGASSPVGSAHHVDTPPDASATSLPAQLAEDLDAGFTAVVTCYEHLVYTVALRMSGSAADAEDLAAEALLRAYRALRDYDPARIAGLRLRPWLLTIVRNTVRNAGRDAARRPAPTPVHPLPERVTTEPEADQLVTSDEMQQRLGAVLAVLPELQRSAVVLRHVVGLPTVEIAEVLGCAEGTAKSHISRGLGKLRVLLANDTTLLPEENTDDAD